MLRAQLRHGIILKIVDIFSRRRCIGFSWTFDPFRLGCIISKYSQQTLSHAWTNLWFKSLSSWHHILTNYTYLALALCRKHKRALDVLWKVFFGGGGKCFLRVFLCRELGTQISNINAAALICWVKRMSDSKSQEEDFLKNMNQRNVSMTCINSTSTFGI